MNKKKLTIFECFITPENERQAKALEYNKKTTIMFFIKQVLGL